MSKAAEMAKQRAGGVPDSAEMEAEKKALEQAGFKAPEEVVAKPAMTGPDPFLNPEGAEAAASAPAVAEEPAVEPEPEVEEEPQDPLTLLTKLPNGPTRAELEGLKMTYDEVLFMPLTDKEVYIYRPLTHIEWHKQIKNTPLVEDQDALKDAVLARCLLWPKKSPGQMARQKAGLRDLLYEVIMQSSYFISPEVALSLVNRL